MSTRRSLLALAVLTSASACLDVPTNDGSQPLLGPIDPVGESGALDVATWNLSWFGSTAFGPSNEDLQLDNVADVIAALELDLWAVEEVVSHDHFEDLIDALDGYAGLLANDPEVEGGTSYYHGGEQKVGLVVRESIGVILGARIILGDHDFDFAGRPPLEVEIELADSGERLIVVVFHAKAGRAQSDWARRRAGALAIRDYLAVERAGEPVIVIGDYNDDLDESIRGSQDSPYEALVDDYFFATFAIALDDISTTVGGSSPIDHALLTGSLAEAYRPGSAAVFPADDFVANYRNTTSDHFPVLLKLDLDVTPEPGPTEIVINEILANEPGGDVSGEFVELYNPGPLALSLAGWTLSDEVGLRHQFDAAAEIAGGEAVVISGGELFSTDTIPSSEGGLGLNNGGDTLTLASANGAAVAEFSYGRSLASDDGVSMTRALDGDGLSAMVSHLEVASSDSSPGTRATGQPF